MKEDEFQEAVELGRANKRAEQLLGNHCSHARVHLVFGTSEVGRMLGLPIGMAQVRCQHVDAPLHASPHVTDLAIKFYEGNCVGCEYRDPNGLLPTIAALVDEHATARAVEERRVAAARAAAVEAWEARRTERRLAVASEGYPARDVADGLDLLDPHPDAGSVDRDQALRARRQLIETARYAPNVFTRRLAETVVDFGLKCRDGSACTVLRLLARAGVVTPEAAVGTAAQLLAVAPLTEAGQVVAEFARALTPELLRSALPNIIALAAEEDEFLGRSRPAEPAALLAVAATDNVAVLDAVVAQLGSDDDARRADAADAAMVLLQVEALNLTVLGQPLVRSIRGEEAIYAGEPKPASAATRALAEAWRGEPELASVLLEREALALDTEKQRELFKVIFFLHRWGDETPVPDHAVAVAAPFLMRRITGDWGHEVASQAAEDLVDFAKRYPHVVIEQTEAIVAVLLSLSDATSEPSQLLVPVEADAGPMDQMLRTLKDMNERQARQNKIQHLAEALGCLAHQTPNRVIPAVVSLLDATTGDDDLDGRTRESLLAVLAHSVTATNVADMLPILYTHLLSTDQGVRAAAIDLWKACAKSVDELPLELAELAGALLSDRFVIVHRKMIKELPALGLPDEYAARLFGHLAGWAETYADRESRALEYVLDVLLWSAHRSHNEALQREVALFAAQRSGNLWHSTRERLLLSHALNGIRSTNVWARAAMETLIAPERLDIHSREDRLFAAMLEEPAGLAALPVDLFGAVAERALPSFAGLATAPLELLQTTGRFSEAAVLAKRFFDLVPDTREFQGVRQYLSAVEAASAAEARVAEGLVHQGSATATSDGSLEEPGRMAFVLHARSRAGVREQLANVPVSDPGAAADVVDEAAELIKGAAVSRHVRHYGAALSIGAKLLRYDAALRAGDSAGPTWLAGAKRQAAVLLNSLAVENSSHTGAAVRTFVEAIATAGPDTVDQLLRALSTVAVPLPLAQPVTYRRFRSEADAPERKPASSPGDQGELPPLAVAVLSVDDLPVVDVVVLQTNQVYDLGVDIRMENWPEWADECRVSLLTVLPLDALTVPTFTFSRADVDRDQHGVLLRRTGTLRCTVERQVGQPPLDLPLHVQFVAGPREGDRQARHEVAEVGGYRRLRLRPYDPTRDGFSEHSQLDHRLLEFYDPLHDDRTLDQDDVRAFCRLFTACVRAAQLIMFNRAFRTGQRVTEQQFHDDLEARLLVDPSLGGRVSRRDPLAGGFDDLRHDNIVAELKVEKQTPRTVDGCVRFLGQPTQYGVDSGSRLSILVVLDHTKKVAPPAVLENYIGWLFPAHHGLDHPNYPSRVGVLIIPTGWPVPSAWSRRRIATRDDV